MVIIEIKNQQRKIPLIPCRIIKTAKRILTHEGVQQACLSIVFVTDRKIKALNKKYLNSSRPTDVLAFDYSFFSVVSREKRIDGEIIISTVTACKNAKRFQTSPHHELTLYVIHGILHLLGYDDHTPRDRKNMRKKERKLTEIL